MNAALVHWYSVAVTFYTVLIASALAVTHHLYSSRVDGAPWWRTSAGRHVMSVTAAIGVTFLFIASGFLWPRLATWPWFVWLYLVLGITGLPAVLTQRLFMLVRLHRKPRTEED